MDSSLTLMVGLDWSEAHLDACAVDPMGKVLGERRFGQDMPGLQQLTEWISRWQSDASRVGIAIELKRGSLITGLLERGFRVATINPKRLDRFRDRFTMAGAKDDRRDAHALADGLRTDPRAFAWLAPEDPLILQIREVSRAHDDLTAMEVADSNRLRDQLLRYYPSALKIDADLDEPWFLELILACPSPQAARRRRVSKVAAILRDHHIRRFDPAQLLETLRQPVPPVAAGAQEAAVHAVTMIARRLQLTTQQRAENLRHGDALVNEMIRRGETDPEHAGEQRDLAIIRSCPGVGLIVLIALLAEGWEPLRHRQYPILRVLSGVAPVTRRSGKKTAVFMRRACSPTLRQALHHMARAAATHYPAWRARHQRNLDRGLKACHSHRILGDQLLRMMIAALESGCAYDESKLRKIA